MFKKAFLVVLRERLLSSSVLDLAVGHGGVFLEFEEVAIKDLEHSPAFRPEVPQLFPSPVTSFAELNPAAPSLSF